MVCLSGKENEVLVRYDKVLQGQGAPEGWAGRSWFHLEYREYLKCMAHWCMKST